MEGLMATWRAASILWEELKEWPECMSSVSFWVKVGTVRLLARLSLSTGMHLIVHRVILLFLPSMRESASVFIFTPVWVGLDEMLGLPLRALLSIIVKDMRLSSEILPVVGVDTDVSSMWCITIRTPYCLEVKHVEVRSVVITTAIICLRSKFLKEIYRDFNFRMSKCTHIPIVTRFDSIWISLTELDLVLLWMIELFHAVVSLGARISQLAVITMLLGYDEWTYLWSVRT